MSTKKTILLLLIVIFNSASIAAARESSEVFPAHIERVAWLNNDEMIIVDRERFSFNQRIIKYSIKTDRFSPVLNEKFQRQLQLDVSYDGRTVFIYDREKMTLTLKRNNKVIFNDSLQKYIDDIAAENGITFVENFRLSKIKMFNHHAVVALSVFGKYNDYASQILSINCPKLKIDHNNKKWVFTEPVNSITITKDEDFYLLCGEQASGKDVLPVVFDFYISRYSTSGRKPEYYKLPIEYPFVKELKVQNNNLIFKGLRIQQAGVLDQFSSNSEDLLIYLPEIKKIDTLSFGTSLYDISQNYIVLTKKYHPFSTFNNLEIKYEIKIYDKPGTLIYGKYIDKLVNYSLTDTPVVPVISPDEKKIVVLKCYAKEKPLIINTSDITPVNVDAPYWKRQFDVLKSYEWYRNYRK